MADIEKAVPESNVLLFPQIVKKVFQFLPAKVLCSVASVCQLWRDEVDIVLRQRRQYCWQLFDANTAGNTCAEADHTFVWSKIRQFFRDLSFRPTTVLLFLTSNLWEERFPKRSRSGKRAKKDKDFNLSTHMPLPADCKVMWCISSGIIGTSWDMKRTEEVEDGEGAAILCMGCHPGLDLVPCKSHYKAHNYFDLTFRLFNSPTQWPDLLDVKAVLLMPHRFQPSLHDLKDQDLCEKFQRPLLVGGILNDCFIHGPVAILEESSRFLLRQPKGASFQSRGAGNPECDSSSCPAPQYGLCGLSQKKCKSNVLGQFLIHGADVKVACVRFHPDVDTEARAEETVLRLKEICKVFPPVHHRLAFMFACVARGEDHYGKVNVECAAFRKHFPGVPLMGFFGNGEIGCDYPIEVGQPHELMHVYTSFITLVSFP